MWKPFLESPNGKRKPTANNTTLTRSKLASAAAGTMNSSPGPAEGAAQRCNPSNYMLRRHGRGDRDRPPAAAEENGTGFCVDRFGYALLGFTAASAATAGLGLVLLSHPAGNSWCVHMLNCSHHRTGDAARAIALDQSPTNPAR